MISASEVYWVMQADTLIQLLIPLAAFAVFGGGISIFVKFFGLHDKAGIVGRNLFIVSAVCASLIAFIPNSKTLAAMVLLPTITSDKVIDTISPEAKELYGLTKDALKNLSHPTKECKNKDE